MEKKYIRLFSLCFLCFHRGIFSLSRNMDGFTKFQDNARNLQIPSQPLSRVAVPEKL
jgi:hypothetical protein